MVLDAVGLGALMKFASHVERLHDRYSERVWGIICQDDVRCRLELMERTRRNMQTDHEEALKASQGD